MCVLRECVFLSPPPPLTLMNKNTIMPPTHAHTHTLCLARHRTRWQKGCSRQFRVCVCVCARVSVCVLGVCVCVCVERLYIFQPTPLFHTYTLGDLAVPLWCPRCQKTENKTKAGMNHCAASLLDPTPNSEPDGLTHWSLQCEGSVCLWQVSSNQFVH